MIRANLEEDREATMARFLAGLNRDIADRVELQDYLELEEMVHMAEKVEKQLRRSRVAPSSKPATTSRPLMRNDIPPWQRRGNSSGNSKVTFETPKTQGVGKPFNSTFKPNTNASGSSSSGSAREIKCWRCQGRGHIASQCPNQRVMILHENGEFESASEEEEFEEEVKEESSPSAESYEHGEALVVQRALHAQPKQIGRAHV